jgi:hypothetical protein
MFFLIWPGIEPDGLARVTSGREDPPQVVSNCSASTSGKRARLGSYFFVSIGQQGCGDVFSREETNQLPGWVTGKSGMPFF